MPSRKSSRLRQILLDAQMLRQRTHDVVEPLAYQHDVAARRHRFVQLAPRRAASAAASENIRNILRRAGPAGRGSLRAAPCAAGAWRTRDSSRKETAAPAPARAMRRGGSSAAESSASSRRKSRPGAPPSDSAGCPRRARRQARAQAWVAAEFRNFRILDVGIRQTTSSRELLLGIFGGKIKIIMPFRSQSSKPAFASASAPAYGGRGLCMRRKV